MKDILEQEWEDIEVQYYDASIWVNGRVYELDKSKFEAHVKTTHNFCKGIPDDVMKEPLLDNLNTKLKNIEDMMIFNDVTKSFSEDFLIGRKIEIENLINELTGK